MKTLLRHLAAVLVAAALWGPTFADAGSIPMDVLTLLYRKESPESASRVDPSIQAAARALEKELLQRNYRLQAPSVDVLKALDKSAHVIVSFAPDAGLSMFYSVYRNTRPDPGVNVAAVEVSITARVFVGSSLLSVEEGRSVMRTNIDPAVREFGERRAFELAAERAAASLVTQVDKRLKSLPPEMIASYAALSDDDAQIIDLPAPPKPPVSAAPQTTVTSPIGAPAVVSPVALTPPVVPAPTPILVVPPPVPGATPMERPAQRYAILIGVSDYSYASQINGAKVPSLSGVPTDMRNIEETFKRLGFARDNITVLFNDAATNAAVRQTISKISAIAGPSDLIAVYISGHGAPVDNKRQGMARPIFYDFRFSQASAAPDFQELLDDATRGNAERVVMILDTCHSGGAALNQSVVVISSRGVTLGQYSGGASAGLLSRSAGNGRNVAILAAARPDEVAIDGGASMGGLFTHHLTQGLLVAPAQDVLRDIVEKRVAPPVIDESRKSCKAMAQRGDGCPTGQQTPTLGFSGRGDMIRM